MIQTYHLLDGGQITASSPEEFVRLLREGSRFDYDCTDQEYMENFARRYGELHGVSVATDTPEHFLTDLQAARLCPVTGIAPLLLVPAISQTIARRRCAPVADRYPRQRNSSSIKAPDAHVTLARSLQSNVLAAPRDLTGK